MIKQTKTRLFFILGASFMLSVAVVSCNNGGEKKEATKDTIVTTPPPAPAVRDSNDTMEPMTGNKAPGTDIKPQ